MVREVTMREGTDHADDEFLKIIARECADCEREYGCSECWNCTLNPTRYTNNHTRAELIRNAYMVSHKRNRSPKRFDFLSFFGGVCLIALVSFYLYMFYYMIARPKNKPKQSVKKEQVSNLASVERKVQSTINYVHNNLIDFNTDGEINCQDYVLLFQMKYPSSQIVYNPFIGDSGHVFIRVWTDDGWLYVEPQLKSNWYVRNAWYKDKYQSVKQYNKVIDRKELMKWQ